MELASSGQLLEQRADEELLGPAENGQRPRSQIRHP
jgi:hypothetical protein